MVLSCPVLKPSRSPAWRPTPIRLECGRSRKATALREAPRQEEKRNSLASTCFRQSLGPEDHHYISTITHLASGAPHEKCKRTWLSSVVRTEKPRKGTFLVRA